MRISFKKVHTFLVLCRGFLSLAMNSFAFRRAKFITKVLSEKDCEDLLAKIKCEHNSHIFQELQLMFPKEIISNAYILPIKDNYFVFSKADKDRITENHMAILRQLASREKLYNPLYVEIENDGNLVVE